MTSKRMKDSRCTRIPPATRSACAGVDSAHRIGSGYLRERVDVGLPAERGDVVHDGVGHCARSCGFAVEVRIRAHANRLAVANLNRLERPWHSLARLLHSLGTDQADRDDR